jgi:fibronectin type 3 domain-containing protein
MKYLLISLFIFLLSNLSFAQGKFGGGDGSGYAMSSVSPYTPTAVIVLNLEIVATNSVALSWNDVDNESYYEIQRSESDEFVNYQTFEVQANQTSYTDLQVTPATTYYYRIRAVYNSN